MVIRLSPWLVQENQKALLPRGSAASDEAEERRSPRWARTDLNRRPTGYEPVALGRTKLRAQGSVVRTPRGAAERSLDAGVGRCSRVFEPLTFRLTADRSTAELRRHRTRRAEASLIAFPARGTVLDFLRTVPQLLDERRHPVQRFVERVPEFPGLLGHHGPIR